MKRRLITTLLAICMMFTLCQSTFAATTANPVASNPLLPVTYMTPQDEASKFFRYKLSAVNGNPIYQDVENDVYSYTSTLMSFGGYLEAITHGKTTSTGLLEVGYFGGINTTFKFTYKGNLPLAVGTKVMLFGKPTGYTTFTYEKTGYDGKVRTYAEQCISFAAERYELNARNVTLSEAEKLYYSGEYGGTYVAGYLSNWAEINANTAVYIDLINNTIDGKPFTMVDQVSDGHGDIGIARFFLNDGRERIMFAAKLADTPYPDFSKSAKETVQSSLQKYYFDYFELYDDHTGTFCCPSVLSLQNYRQANDLDLHYLSNTRTTDPSYSRLFDDTNATPFEEPDPLDDGTGDIYTQDFGFVTLETYFPDYVIECMPEESGHSNCHVYSLYKYGEGKYYYAYLDKTTGEWDDSKAPGLIDEAVG